MAHGAIGAASGPTSETPERTATASGIWHPASEDGQWGIGNGQSGRQASAISHQPSEEEGRGVRAEGRGGVRHPGVLGIHVRVHVRVSGASEGSVLWTDHTHGVSVIGPKASVAAPPPTRHRPSDASRCLGASRSLRRRRLLPSIPPPQAAPPLLRRRRLLPSVAPSLRRFPPTPPPPHPHPLPLPVRPCAGYHRPPPRP
jgi:hypothetical protein